MKLSNILSLKFIDNIKKNSTDFIKMATNDKNINIVIIICYIIFIVTHRPVKLLEIFKRPIVQIVCMVYIIYISNTNLQLSLALGIAFIISVTTHHPLSDAPIPIINVENFSSEQSDDHNHDHQHDDEEDQSSDDENSDDEDQDDEVQDDEEEDDEDQDDESETSSIESNDDISEENFQGGIFKKGSMNDTFKDLHLAIHKLENFISTK